MLDSMEATASGMATERGNLYTQINANIDTLNFQLNPAKEKRLCLLPCRRARTPLLLAPLLLTHAPPPRTYHARASLQLPAACPRCRRRSYAPSTAAAGGRRRAYLYLPSSTAATATTPAPAHRYRVKLEAAADAFQRAIEQKQADDRAWLIFNTVMDFVKFAASAISIPFVDKSNIFKADAGSRAKMVESLQLVVADIRNLADPSVQKAMPSVMVTLNDTSPAGANAAWSKVGL